MVDSAAWDLIADHTALTDATARQARLAVIANAEAKVEIDEVYAKYWEDDVLRARLIGDISKKWPAPPGSGEEISRAEVNFQSSLLYVLVARNRG